jgi:hypothetical protein
MNPGFSIALRSISTTSGPPDPAHVDLERELVEAVDVEGPARDQLGGRPFAGVAQREVVVVEVAVLPEDPLVVGGERGAAVRVADHGVVGQAERHPGGGESLRPGVAVADAEEVAGAAVQERNAAGDQAGTAAVEVLAGYDHGVRGGGDEHGDGQREK